MLRNERLVKRKFPLATIVSDLDGYMYVQLSPSTNELDEDLDFEDIPAREYFMPLTKDKDTAWQYAAMCLRITQNFNRTHPERILDEDFNAKLERLQIRKRKKILDEKKKQKNRNVEVDRTTMD